MPARWKREIPGKKNVAIATQDDGFFHHVLQLTNIAGPVMPGQAAKRLVGDLLRGKILLPADLCYKMPDQLRHIGGAFTEWRQRYRHYVEPVVQIFTELSL